jgi:hypothetical protein
LESFVIDDDREFFFDVITEWGCLLGLTKSTISEVARANLTKARFLFGVTYPASEPILVHDRVFVNLQSFTTGCFENLQNFPKQKRHFESSDEIEKCR